MFLVLAFFYRAITVQLLWKYHILLLFTEEDSYMVSQIREIRESSEPFSVSAKVR